MKSETICSAMHCSDNDDDDGDDETISELLYAYCLFASPHARPFDSRLNPILQIFISPYIFWHKYLPIHFAKKLDITNKTLKL